jgi:hypothetical protein
MSEAYDTNFSLPSVDDDPDTELGVLLMGLAVARLLAGLGVASRDLARDPTEATLLVDQLRHDLPGDLPFDAAVAAGALRWLGVRDGLAAAGQGTPSAALRQLWTAAAERLSAVTETVPELRTHNDAERVYLVACWLRRAETNRIAEEHDVLPERPT